MNQIRSSQENLRIQCTAMITRIIVRPQTRQVSTSHIPVPRTSICVTRLCSNPAARSCSGRNSSLMRICTRHHSVTTKNPTQAPTSQLHTFGKHITSAAPLTCITPFQVPQKSLSGCMMASWPVESRSVRRPGFARYFARLTLMVCKLGETD